MKAPLYDQLIKYNKHMTSFHMPGHKFGKILEMKRLSLLDLDVTEVPGLDNLYDADGIILRAQKKMAFKYKAKESIFLTNGSTAGILASMMAVCKPGDSLIVARNSHNSVWNGLILGGIKPIYINPSYQKDYEMLGGISIVELEKLLIAYPEAKGVLIVSPTYEGFVSDIEQIAKLVHDHKKILIVDEAHGAHFVWHHKFPKSAIECGADIVIQSMHKTLPTLSQSALLHIGSDRIQREILIKHLQMIQTSSPSYVMMGLMDYIRAEMEQHHELWEDYLKGLLETRKNLKTLENLVLISEDICQKADIIDVDKSKLVIDTSHANITGIELGHILRTKYYIQVEVEAKNYIIAMSTVGDTPSDLEGFSKALHEIDSQLVGCTPMKSNFNMIKSENDQSILPRDVFYAEKEYVPIDQCDNKMSAANIMLYPPGIPLICIGERFSKEIIHYIKGCSEKLIGVTYYNQDPQVCIKKEH